MLRLLLAVAVVIAIVALARWLGRAPPAKRAKALQQILLFGGGAILLVLAIAFRNPLVALLGVALPWFQRAMMARGLWNKFQSMRRPSSGQTSRVETAFLRMTLDHDSGDLGGEVISGSFSGSTLADLGLEQLIDLLRELRANDAQSAALLEAYLDRTQPAEWRERVDGETVDIPSSGPMNHQEAAEILGVDVDTPKKAVVQAHRRLIQRLHADRGGSDYLAAMVNKAKDVLLNK